MAFGDHPAPPAQPEPPESDQPIGKGATTLDYLKVRYKWLGELIDKAQAREKELLAEVARLKEWRDSVSSAVKNIPEFHTGEWGGDKEGWGFHFEVVNWLIRERDRLNALIRCPHNGDWFEGVRIEAAYQQERWGQTSDAGKAPEDWFWLVGYLAGKALRASIDGKADKADKAKHHTISTAAALLNWYRHVAGQPGDMRPGIEPPANPERKP